MAIAPQPSAVVGWAGDGLNGPKPQFSLENAGGSLWFERFPKKMVMEEKQCSKNRSVWPAKQNFMIFDDFHWYSLKVCHFFGWFYCS
jgi:hypothetical protein